MSLTIDARQFASAVSRAQGHIRPAKGMTVLGCLRLAAADGELQIEATDLDLWIRVTVPAQGELAATLVDGQRLGAILARVKDRGEMQVRSADQTLQMTVSRARFTVPTLDVASWPRAHTMKAAASFTLPGKQFAAAFASLLPAMSTEETRYYLNGIYLSEGGCLDQNKSGCLVAVATDGHQCFARELVPEEMPEDMPGIIVPAFTSTALAKLTAIDGDIDVSCNDDLIEITAGDLVLRSKLIQATYPDFRRVIPRMKPQLEFAADAIAAAAEAVAAGSTEKLDNGSKAIVLSFAEEATTFSIAERASAASGSDAVAHEKIAAPGAEEIGVAAGYLVAAVHSLGTERVALAVENTTAPIVLTSTGFDDRIAIVMPRRI